MDEKYYSKSVLEEFLRKNMGPVAYPAFLDGDVTTFRREMKKRTEQTEAIVQSCITDTIRHQIYRIIRHLTAVMAPMGDLIISGGEAFNHYFSKEHRVVTSDIDTKFVPTFAYDTKFFGKLQVTKLILWNELGKIAKRLGDTIKQRAMQFARSRLGRMLDVKIGQTTRRYTIKPKSKKDRVLIDVEIFALDLNMTYLGQEASFGGILDIAFMRPHEFGSEILHTRVRKGAFLMASKKFLMHDVYIMQKLGLRPGKKEKDRRRMFLFATHILHMKSLKNKDSIDSMYRRIQRIPAHRTSKAAQKTKKFPVELIRKAMRIDPHAYQEYTTPPNLKKLKKRFLFGSMQPGKGYVPTFANERYNLQKNQWVPVTKTAYVRRQHAYRLKTAVAEKRPLPKNIQKLNLLYGYNAQRNKWLPVQVLESAGAIAGVGLRT